MTENIPPAPQDQPNLLQKVTVPIVEHSKCRKSYAGISEVTPRMICAGTGEKDSCNGDSGSPLLCHANCGRGQSKSKFGAFSTLSQANSNLDSRFTPYVVCGLVSWGLGCARPGKPGVYSNVSVMRNWILHHIGSY